MLKTKQIVVGMGEIGLPILKLLSKSFIATGYDTRKELMNTNQYLKLKDLDTSFLHVCIPYTDNFIPNIINLYKKFKPKCIVIHSTVKPNTTNILQKKLSIPVIYSATRGVHKRMFYDLKRYVKFFALEKDSPKKRWANITFSKIMAKCGVKTKRMSKPITLELAKIICDTSYYGWLINYAQTSRIIAIKNKVDYDEMWSFADEIHKFLGNRPKMFPGFIGGHCVIPNLSLIDNEVLNTIKKINSKYSKISKI